MTQRVIIFTGDPGDPEPITDSNPLHVKVHEPLSVTVLGGTIVIDPVDLVTLAQETTLTGIEAKTDNIDVLLSTRASEATLGNRLSEAAFLARMPVPGQSSMSGSVPVVIAGDQSPIPAAQSGTWIVGAAQLGPWSIAQSGVWTVAVSGTVPISAAALPLPSGAATESSLGLVKAKTDNLDLALSTRNAEATQLLVKAKTDNLDLALSTRLAESTFTTRHPVVGQATSAASMPVVIASDQSALIARLGDSTGKTIILKTGTLAESVIAADQVILTYTVTAGKTFYLQGWDWSVGRSAFGTATEFFGTISLENPSGTKRLTWLARGQCKDSFVEYLTEPLPIAGSTVIRFVTTTVVVTAFTWAANLIGYEI